MSAALPLVVAPPAVAEAIYGVDAGAFYDSNLTQAQNAPDVRADGAAALSAFAGSFIAPSGEDAFTLSVDARGEAYHRFHGLNLLGAGASAEYRHKFGLGYAAPWLRFVGSAEYDGYQQNLRTGARWSALIELGRRFTEQLDAAIGGSLERRYAQNGEPVVPGIPGTVFNLRGESAYLRAAYPVSEPLLIAARFEIRRGDVVSSTRRNLDIFEASSAIAADPTFGSDFFAYRLRGTTGTITASASWALDASSSLNLSYAGERTRAYDDLDYHGYRIDFSYAYRY